MPRIAPALLSILALVAGALYPAPGSAGTWSRLKAPGAQMSFNGYSVVAPSERGWLQLAGGVFDVGFSALLSRTQSWGLTAATQPAPQRFASSDALLQFVRARLAEEADPKRFRLVDAQGAVESWPGALCVRLTYKAHDYQALNRSGPYSILEAAQLTCVHPSAPDLLVELAYHERYSFGEKPGALAELGERFLHSVRFTRPVSAEVRIKDAAAACELLSQYVAQAEQRYACP